MVVTADDATTAADLVATGETVMRRVLLAAALLVGCRSESINKNAPAPQETVSSTTLVYGPMGDAATPDCTIHQVTDAFVPGQATMVATVSVQGDYTHGFGNVSVTRPKGAPWSGTFSGPREAFFDMLRSHICTKANAYAAKAGDNKDPLKGPVVLTVYELEPNEKADVDALCHAESHAPDGGAADARDRAAMEWATDAITSPKWDAWRRGFQRSRMEMFVRNEDAGTLFRARGADLAAAAHAFGIKCPTAAEWEKR